LATTRMQNKHFKLVLHALGGNLGSICMRQAGKEQRANV